MYVNIPHHIDRFDRFRLDLKGTWKDLPLEGNGLVYDLAAHTLDQALILFGRPTKLTAFRENIRGAGSKEQCADDGHDGGGHHVRVSTGGYKGFADETAEKFLCTCIAPQEARQQQHSIRTEQKPLLRE